MGINSISEHIGMNKEETGEADSELCDDCNCVKNEMSPYPIHYNTVHFKYFL